MFPACAFLAVMSPVQRVSAAMLAVVSLIAVFAGPRLPAAPASWRLRVITAAVLALSLSSRAIVIRKGGVSVESFADIRAGIPRDWPLSLQDDAP